MTAWTLDFDPACLKGMPAAEFLGSESLVLEPAPGDVSTPETLPLGDGSPDDSLETARTWLRANLAKGAACPCCGQNAKIYRKVLSVKMGLALLLLRWFYEARPEYRGRFIHATRYFVVLDVGPELRASLYGDLGALCHWGLLQPGERGCYRLTQRGLDFVTGKSKIREAILTYNDTLLGFDGPEVDIYEAVAPRFDLRAFEAKRLAHAIDQAYDIDALASLEPEVKRHPDATELLPALYERLEVLASL